MQQIKKPWYDAATGEEVDNWILAAAQPEFSGSKLKTIIGSITDITLQKRSAKDAEARAKLSEQLEQIQTRRLQEAEETRRAQNSFIDITSHEMRNPLSIFSVAILYSELANALCQVLFCNVQTGFLPHSQN